MLSVTIQVTAQGGIGFKHIAHVGVLNIEGNTKVSDYQITLDGEPVARIQKHTRADGYAALLAEVFKELAERGVK